MGPSDGRTNGGATTGGLDADRAHRARARDLSEQERVVHELQVQQLELELQNRALRESQAQVEASRDRYAELYDFAPVAYFTFDLEGCVREANLTGAAMVGRERAEVLDLPFVALAGVQEPALFRAHLRRCLETRAPVTSELRLAPPRREEVIVQLVSAPVLDAAGAVAAYRTAFTDVTLHRTAEAERDRAFAAEQRIFEEARSALRARDAMLAMVAHDLRSPLAAIVISATLLPPGGGKHAEVIGRTAQHMSRLVDDLLTTSTIEAGRFVGEPQAHGASALIDEALQSMEPLAAARAIQLTRLAPAALPAVLCDPDRILQVLANLLGNAAKLTARGGEIRLDAEASDDEVRFAVSDTGPGIRAEHLAHLFEPYWKGKPSGSPGVGLGLYIAKAIVDALGGRIWVETELGAGTTFFFTLRRAPPQPG